MPRRDKRPRLGRGLSSLIRSSSEGDPARGEYRPVETAATSDAARDRRPASVSGGVVMTLAVDDIGPNPYQPRRDFDEQSLAELAGTIRTHGVLQPLLVAEAEEAEGERRYCLVAGERRLRAARLAGLAEVPCMVRRISDQEMLEAALIENTHRADLNPIERARAYRDLMDRFALTQRQVAGRVAQPRATVANYLRLLDLCDAVQALLLGGSITFGHAKVLAAVAGDEAGQVALARRVVKEGLSVRQLEGLVKASGAGGGGNEGQSPKRRPPYIEDVERQLTERVGTRVSVRPGRARHSGKIVLEYYSLEDFDRIVAMLGARIDS